MFDRRGDDARLQADVTAKQRCQDGRNLRRGPRTSPGGLRPAASSWRCCRGRSQTPQCTLILSVVLTGRTKRRRRHTSNHERRQRSLYRRASPIVTGNSSLLKRGTGTLQCPCSASIRRTARSQSPFSTGCYPVADDAHCYSVRLLRQGCAEVVGLPPGPPSAAMHAFVGVGRSRDRE